MRLLLLALAAVLLSPAAAQASKLEITWPERRAYEPGERLTVRIASDRRVRAVLVRESSKGRVLRTIRRRTLRSGRFSAVVPSPGRYSLRLKVVGGHSYKRRVTVTQLTHCTTRRGDRAKLRLGATTATAGGVLPYTLVNTSRGCLSGGPSYSFDHLLPDGSWEGIPTGLVFPAVLIFIPAGESFAKQAKVPAGAVPGTYRVLDSLIGNAGAIPVAAQFQVVG